MWWLASLVIKTNYQHLMIPEKTKPITNKTGKNKFYEWIGILLWSMMVLICSLLSSWWWWSIVDSGQDFLSNNSMMELVLFVCCCCVWWSTRDIVVLTVTPPLGVTLLCTPVDITVGVSGLICSLLSDCCWLSLSVELQSTPEYFCCCCVLVAVLFVSKTDVDIFARYVLTLWLVFWFLLWRESHNRTLYIRVHCLAYCLRVVVVSSTSIPCPSVQTRLNASLFWFQMLLVSFWWWSSSSVITISRCYNQHVRHAANTNTTLKSRGGY